MQLRGSCRQDTQQGHQAVHVSKLSGKMGVSIRRDVCAHGSSLDEQFCARKVLEKVSQCDVMLQLKFCWQLEGFHVIVFFSAACVAVRGYSRLTYVAVCGCVLITFRVSGPYLIPGRCRHLHLKIRDLCSQHACDVRQGDQPKA